MAVILPIVSKFDASGIKKAQGAFGKLSKLGVASAAVFAAVGAAAVNYGVDAVKAATDDLKAQKLLAGQMAKNAKATKAQIKDTEEFISKLSMQTGIMDDDLRPAMAKLVRGTGSVKKAQDLLTLALDASAASGKPLATVSDALTKAFNGNETSLTRMFPNLKKSKDLMGDLKKMVGGTAKEVATPWERINVAFQEMKERIGTALLPYVSKLSDYLMGFFDKLNDPKSAEAKAFDGLMQGIKNLMDEAGVFFAMFDTSGKNNPMSGFFTFMEVGLRGLAQALNGIIVGWLQAKELTGNATKSDKRVLASEKVFGKALLEGKSLLKATEVKNQTLDTLIRTDKAAAGKEKAKGLYDAAFRNTMGYDAPLSTADQRRKLYGLAPLSPTSKTTKSTQNTNIKIDVKVGAGVSGDAVGREIVRRIKEYEKSNGAQWRRGSL